MVSPQVRHPVVIPVGLQVGVAVPAIGVHAAARLDGLGDERLERLGGSIGDTGHPNAPDAAAHLFGRDHDQGFRRGRTPARPPEPAHQGLVDLDLPGEPIPPWAHHGPAQRVQPRPGGLIAPQAQDLRQAQGAGPGLLTGHVPHRPEPRRQGGARAVEDGARRDRSLVTAARALPQHRAHGPGAGVPAAWTDKPRRPAQLREIGPTSFFGGEAGLELRERSRVILHARRH